MREEQDVMRPAQPAFSGRWVWWGVVLVSLTIWGLVIAAIVAAFWTG